MDLTRCPGLLSQSQTPALECLQQVLRQSRAAPAISAACSQVLHCPTQSFLLVGFVHARCLHSQAGSLPTPSTAPRAPLSLPLACAHHSAPAPTPRGLQGEESGRLSLEDPGDTLSELPKPTYRDLYNSESSVSSSVMSRASSFGNRPADSQQSSFTAGLGALLASTDSETQLPSVQSPFALHTGPRVSGSSQTAQVQSCSSQECAGLQGLKEGLWGQSCTCWCRSRTPRRGAGGHGQGQARVPLMHAAAPVARRLSEGSVELQLG